MSIIFSDGFESGDFTAWDTAVKDGSDLQVLASAALAGTKYGMAVFIDGTGQIYGEQAVDMSSTYYRCRFYLDPNGLTMADGTNHAIINTYRGSGGGAFQDGIRLGKTDANGFNIDGFVELNTDSASVLSSFDISDEPHWIEFEVFHHSSAGYMKIWVDGFGTVATESTGLNTDTSALSNGGWGSTFILGAGSGIDLGTSGTYYLDELVVNDDGAEIGPVGGRGRLGYGNPNRTHGGGRAGVSSRL